jgi:hypothetical protein
LSSRSRSRCSRQPSNRRKWRSRGCNNKLLVTSRLHP